LLIAAVIYRHGRKPSHGQRRFLLRVVSVIVAVGIGVWLLLPTVPVQAGYRGKLSLQQIDLMKAMRAYYENAKQEPDWSSVNLPQVLFEGSFLKSPMNNPFTDKPIRRERSPGNFDVRKIDGKWHVCTYNADGVEYLWKLGE